MNVHSHLMQLHHLLVGAVCALAVAGCAGTQQFPPEMEPMDVDGTYYQVTDHGVGTWETTGSARTDGRPCTWTRTTEAPATIASTIAIGRTDQTARVTVRSGEYFVFYGCKPWNKVA